MENHRRDDILGTEIHGTWNNFSNRKFTLNPNQNNFKLNRSGSEDFLN